VYKIEENRALETPVLIIGYRRPAEMKRVLAAVRQVSPARLYAACDGPSMARPGEAALVAEVRQVIRDSVDWDCDLKTRFLDENVGCKVGVSSAIDWFFENEEEGIILEDDTVPAPSFFTFCAQLLEHYRDDPRVMHIGGTNPVDSALHSNAYYFSIYNRIWGWATWRRAWRHYEGDIPFWPEVRDSAVLEYLIPNSLARSRLSNAFDSVHEGRIDTWDYQWFLCRLIRGLAIIPCVNLVSNIGFHADGTHTRNPDSSLASLPAGEIRFPLQHPIAFLPDYERDLKWGNILGAERQRRMGRLRSAVGRWRGFFRREVSGQ